jgi:hypothetical protein
MESDEHDIHSAICSVLDSYHTALTFQLNLFRIMLLAHGHRDGFANWCDGDAFGLPRPSSPIVSLNEGAHRLLARLDERQAMVSEPIVPGFEPALTDSRLMDRAH